MVSLPISLSLRSGKAPRLQERWCGLRFESALALVHERCGIKPSSQQSWTLVASARKGFGNPAAQSVLRS